MLCMFIFYFLYLFHLYSSFHLSSKQFYLIHNLIQKPNLPQKYKYKLHHILYTAFEKYSVKKAIEFKKYHYHKCQNIDINDFIIASKFGLFQAIKNYNGKSNFLYYSNIYIKSELLKTLTSHYSISPLSKTIRKKNKNNFTKEQLYKYNKLLSTRLIGYDNHWQFDSYINKETNLELIEKKENNIEIWNKINNLKPFFKKIIHLKFNVDFNKIRSNKEISILMCCTEENIRFNLNKAIKLLN